MTVKEKTFATSTDPRVRAGEEANVVTNCDHLAKLEIKIETGPFSACVPVTNQIKGYPFEVALSGAGATGAALVDQLKSLDWQARQAERKGKATIAEMAEIRAKVKLLLKLG